MVWLHQRAPEKNTPTSATCLILPSRSPINDSFQPYSAGKFISTSRLQTCKSPHVSDSRRTTKGHDEFYEKGKTVMAAPGARDTWVLTASLSPCQWRGRAAILVPVFGKEGLRQDQAAGMLLLPCSWSLC